jgi:hypothetical protein
LAIVDTFGPHAFREKPMVLTLMRKELRETRAFAVLSLLIYLVYVSNLTGVGGPMARSLVGLVPGMATTPPDIPFVQGNFGTMLFFVGAMLAIALGFRQSAWEPSQGTALYLLHLPLKRRSIVSTKLLTGVVMLLICTPAPCLSRGIRQRDSPGPLVRIEIAAAGVGLLAGGDRVFRAVLVADRCSDPLLCRVSPRQRHPLGD